VLSQDLLPTPQQIKSALPLTDKAKESGLAQSTVSANISDYRDLTG
jgi:hypothetical protein